MFVGAPIRTDDATKPSGSSAKAASKSAEDCMPKREIVQDVRLHIARIEERSRQLLGASHENRVRRSVEGLAHGAATEATAASRLSLLSGGGDGPATSANPEVFLSQIGYNVQEQMRLLRHIEATRPVPSGAAVASSPTGPSSSHSIRSPQTAARGAINFDSIGGRDAVQAPQLSVAAFLAAKRSALMGSLVAESQTSLLEREREVAAQTAATLWEARKAELAESIGLRNLLEATASSRTTTASVYGRQAVRGSTSGPLSSVAGSVPPPNSFAAKRLAKMSHIVLTAQPSEWLTRFANAAVDAANSSSSASSGGDTATAMAALWSTLHRVLSWHKPVAARDDQAVAEASLLATVAASRADLENRAMRGIFLAVHGERAQLPDDFRRMHPDKFRDLIQRYIAREAEPSTAAAPWIATFHAARCGRYDAAALSAPDPSVAALFKHVADVTASKRQSTAVPQVLQDHVQRAAALFREDATAKSPFRAAVLLILLAGDVGSDEASALAVQNVVVRVASSLDDVLWFRLTLVRHIRSKRSDGQPSPPSVQTLEEVQRQLLTDQQQLLVTVHGSVDALVDLLLHALLFNASVRLLLDKADTACDGIHVAMVLHQAGLLGPLQSAEPVIDFHHALQRHVALLVRVDSVSDASDNIASAAFRYFEATGNVRAFVDLCASTPGVAPILFGRSNGSLGGTLLAKNRSAPPSKAVVAAAIEVAEVTAANGAVATAVDVFVAAALAADRIKEDALLLASLRQALRVINPALSHRILKLLAGVTSNLAELHPSAESLKKEVQQRVQQLPAAEVDAFDHLRTLAEVASAHVAGDVNTMLNAFFTLPFVPSTMDAVDSKAHAFNSTVAEEVAAVMVRLLPVVVQALLDLARSGEDPVHMRSIGQCLNRWFLQWSRPGPADVAGQLRAHLEKFPSY